MRNMTSHAPLPSPHCQSISTQPGTSPSAMMVRSTSRTPAAPCGVASIGVGWPPLLTFLLKAGLELPAMITE